jgi:hypothetical protein
MTTFRCPTCSRDLPIGIDETGKQVAVCGQCMRGWELEQVQTAVPTMIDGVLKMKCTCGCKQYHIYDPSRKGVAYKEDEPWVQMLDRHARNFIDMPVVIDFDKVNTPLRLGPTDVEATTIFNPVKAGIFVKMGPKAEGLRYLNRLLKSVMISDAKQPMVIWLHGWDVGGDPNDQTNMSDIYMGRDQGVPMLANQMEKDGILAMVDQDIVLPPRWYSHVREVFDRDPTIGALYPMVQLEADTAIQLVQVEYQGGWQSGGYGDNTVHNYNPDLSTYIHKGRGQIFLDDAKIMGTLAWRCTDMAVFYRASMVQPGLQYTHDWSRWKLKQGFKTVIDKDLVVAHYKEFNERGFGDSNRQVPFFACKTCNHICYWGEKTFNYICPTCNKPAVRMT